MTAYYNENDPKAAAWLRDLILCGHIAAGDVDERSIEDVLPSDLAGYTQCHFFAGIGGWSYALRLAGWPDDREVWTGSCPCQPFSAAGKGAGFADERHLWPAWDYLISECRPAVIFGEQVDKALAWLDLVFGNLESQDYACWAAIIGAHSVGAPHIRQRIYWMADRNGERFSQRREYDGESQQQHQRPTAAFRGNTGGCNPSGLAHTDLERYDWHISAERTQQAQEYCDAVLEHAESDGRIKGWAESIGWLSAERCIVGPDGKRRPIKSGLEPLVNGLPGRVGLLRGYGNAIVPQDGAAFIQAYLSL